MIPAGTGGYYPRPLWFPGNDYPGEPSIYLWVSHLEKQSGGISFLQAAVGETEMKFSGPDIEFLSRDKV